MRGGWMREAMQYEDIDKAALAKAKRSLVLEAISDPLAMPCKPIGPEEASRALDAMLVFLDERTGEKLTSEKLTRKLRDWCYVSEKIARTVVGYWQDIN